MFGKTPPSSHVAGRMSDQEKAEKTSAMLGKFKKVVCWKANKFAKFAPTPSKTATPSKPGSFSKAVTLSSEDGDDGDGDEAAVDQEKEVGHKSEENDKLSEANNESDVDQEGQEETLKDKKEASHDSDNEPLRKVRRRSEVGSVKATSPSPAATPAAKKGKEPMSVIKEAKESEEGKCTHCCFCVFFCTARTNKIAFYTEITAREVLDESVKEAEENFKLAKRKLEAYALLNDIENEDTTAVEPDVRAIYMKMHLNRTVLEQTWQLLQLTAANEDKKKQVPAVKVRFLSSWYKFVKALPGETCIHNRN